eukprot:3679995-Amphidinium_carterae.1
MSESHTESHTAAICLRQLQSHILTTRGRPRNTPRKGYLSNQRVTFVLSVSCAEEDRKLSNDMYTVKVTFNSVAKD